FLPGGKVACVDGGGGGRQWEVATGKELQQFAGQDGGSGGAFSADGKLAAMAGQSASVCETATGKHLFVTPNQGNTVAGLAFSPHGKLLASGTTRMIRLWDVATGKEVRAIEGHGDLVIRLAFSPDGKTLASVGWDRAICLWETATGKELHRMT